MPTTVLITGGAVRLGAAIAQAFFERGCDLLLHYNQSADAAKALAQRFNQQRAQSCSIIKADLSCSNQAQGLISIANEKFGTINHLINNASIFYPTPIKQSSAESVALFFNTNFKAPVKLVQGFANQFERQQNSPQNSQQNSSQNSLSTNASIVNLIDIYAEAGLANHGAYVASKTALLAATRQLAFELAPSIRVNAVSPGAILWPENNQDTNVRPIDAQQAKQRQTIIEQSALKQLGHPDYIAATVCYLALDAHYTTGANIKVDGGRRWYI